MSVTINEDFEEDPLDPEEYDKYIECVNSRILAYYFYLRRLEWNRDGNRDDDHFKAEYAIKLLNYLVSRNPKKYASFLQISNSPNIDEQSKNYLLNLVFGIFDTAYYMHLDNPQSSPYENFIAAEKVCCREKEIESIAYFEYLDRINNGRNGTPEDDWRAAEKIIRKREISELAYYIHQNRLKNGITGTPEKDWCDAEEEYNKNELTRRIAHLCWQMSCEKHLPESVFWCYAINVLHNLGDPEPKDSADFPIDDKVIEAVKKVLESASKSNMDKTGLS